MLENGKGKSVGEFLSWPLSSVGEVLSGICRLLQEYADTLKMLTSLMHLWEECALW